jgi:putative acetyltransferase
MAGERVPTRAGAAVKRVVVRAEVPSDVEAIFEVTRAAFEGHPYSEGAEQYIVDALRSAGGLTLSLVATLDGRVVGHVAFSPVTLSDGSEGWFGVGPVSVVPELQRRGIGSALMSEGLARLRALGAAGCVLVGDPAYYVRFGFRARPELDFDYPPEVCLTLPFADFVPHARVAFHAAFAATAASGAER